MDMSELAETEDVYLLVTRSPIEGCLRIDDVYDTSALFPNDFDGTLDFHRYVDIHTHHSTSILLVDKDYLFEYLSKYTAPTFLVDVIWTFESGLDYNDNVRVKNEVSRLKCAGCLTNLSS